MDKWKRLAPDACGDAEPKASKWSRLADDASVAVVPKAREHSWSSRAASATIPNCSKWQTRAATGHGPTHTQDTAPADEARVDDKVDDASEPVCQDNCIAVHEIQKHVFHEGLLSWT